MENPFFFLVNPAAGRGAAQRAWPLIEQTLRAANVPFEVAPVADEEEALAQAREAAFRPVRAVVVVGGDGTVHGAINGLLRATHAGGGYLPLGVVAVGRSNRLASLMGLTLHKPIAATRRLFQAQPRHLDVGVARGEGLPDGERFFALDLGVGLEALLVGSLDPEEGVGSLALLRLLRRFQPPTVAVTLRGETRTQPLVALTVANSTPQVGGLRLAPDARPDDGQLDLCLVRDLTRPRLLTLLQQARQGQHREHVAVTMERATRLVVASEAPLPLHLDGLLPRAPVQRVEVELLPSQLALLG